MTIKINAPKDDGEKRIKLFLPVPLGLLNIRFIWKYLPPEQRQYQAIARDIVKALKEFKKENGPWNLVEVDAEDAKVLIRI